jgi:uncharacterized protein (TIGR02270 family)
MPKILPKVVDQLAEEAAFLWQLRDAAVSAPHYLLADLVRLDARVEAQLDGLVVVGDPGWDVVRQALETGEPGEVFAAGVLALESGDAAKVAEVLQIGAATRKAARAVLSALGWLTPESATRHIDLLLASPDLVRKRIGIAASAVHRKSPGRAALQAAFASDDPLLRARALRAAGELGSPDLARALKSHIWEEDTTCRFWAAWSLALVLGDRDALIVLQSMAEEQSPFGERAVNMAMRRLPIRAAKTFQKKLAAIPEKARLAIIAAGALGDAELVPWLIEQMKVPAHALVAGEAFSLMTGVHIAYDKLEGLKPDGFEAGPTEDPTDENVAMDPDENLAWPDVDAIKIWWKARQGSFANGTRYILGQPVGPETLHRALRDAYQRQRAAAALELAILYPGKPLFEVRAPGFRQLEQLVVSKATDA